MENYEYVIKIPKERIAVLIGTNGKIKKQIEQVSKTNIDIDSQEGDVTISGKDAITLFSAREIIHAIGRGFNPEIAMNLIKQDYAFESINLVEYCKTKHHLLRIKGRVIGAEGKSRRYIEELTDTNVSVYGKTISIIGEVENVSNARRALQSLIDGSSHSYVYKFLEKKRAEMKRYSLGIPKAE